MNGKIMKKTILSCVAALLIVALAIALISLVKPNNVDAAAGVLQATYVANHGELTEGDLSETKGGKVIYHRSDSQETQYLNDTYGAGSILKITSGAQLYNFLNGNGSVNGTTYDYAYLANDVSIAYKGVTAGGTYDFTADKTSSGVVFTKKLDGNGYTVGIWGGVGRYEYTQQDETETFYTEGEESSIKIRYQYTGLMVGVNKGTLSNFTIEYKSNHTGISAHTGNSNYSGMNTSSSFEGDDDNDTTDLYGQEDISATAVGGVVAGMNGEGGVIDNVRLNLNNSFKVIKKRGAKLGDGDDDRDMKNNTGIVGGIVGRAGVGSTLKNSQIDIAETAGVYSGVVGATLPLTTYDSWALAVAGGLVGKIDSGNAFVQNCAVTGGGIVKGLVSRASGKDNDSTEGRKSSGFYAYAGGAVGACLQITDRDVLRDGGIKSAYKQEVIDGQIDGIVSTWTGDAYDNYFNNQDHGYGQLFGSVGGTTRAVRVLFDVLSFREDNGQDVTSEGSSYKTLDAVNSQAIYGWIGIYPTTEGGDVIVRLDEYGSNVLVHAFAKDSKIQVANDDGTTFQEVDPDVAMLEEAAANRKYSFSKGQNGNIIWKATAGDSVLISLAKELPVYAEKKTISATDADQDYTYSFGRITSLSFVSTNGDKSSREYLGASEQLNLPNVVNSDNEVFYNLGDSSVSQANRVNKFVIPATDKTPEKTITEWTVLRNGESAVSRALPGTYSMSIKANEKTYIDLGYYNDDEKRAAWAPANYKYVITKGVLKYGDNSGGDNTEVSPTWAKKATFQLSMLRSNDFDFIRAVRNGEVIMSDDKYTNVQDVYDNSTDKIFYTKNGAVVDMEIKESTGKKGATYSFYAYVKDGDKNVIVAQTSSVSDRLVKIDNESPAVSEISYYTIDEHGNTIEYLSESQLKEWRTDRVVAEYTVTDTKSGINYADSLVSNAEIINEDLGNGVLKSTVILSVNNDIAIEYIDVAGNKTVVELQADVDYMQVDPSLARQGLPIYNKVTDWGYATDDVVITFNAKVGCSDWLLQYSWENDANGKSIWVNAQKAVTDENGEITSYIDFKVKSGRQSFRINWNMYDYSSPREFPFKLRMVNLQGLYGDAKDNAVYLSINGTEQPEGKVGEYAINKKVASIYFDTSLKALKISGGKFDGQFVGNLTAEERSELFDKLYDGSDDYVNPYSFSFDVAYGATEYALNEADADKANEDGFVSYASQVGFGVLFTPAYREGGEIIGEYVNDTTTKPMSIGVDLKYDSINVREAKNLIITLNPDSEILEKYNLYFVDNKRFVNVEFYDKYTTVSSSLTSDKCKTPAKIETFVVDKIELAAEVRGAKEAEDFLYYGETVPQTIDVFVGVANQPVTVALKSAAQSKQKVGDYPVTGSVDNDALLGNIYVDPSVINPATIEIKPLPVPVDIKLKEGSSPTFSDHIPGAVKAGTKYEFSATYKGIDDNNTKSATIELTLNGGESVKNKPITKLGEYTITITIDDGNYIVKDGYYDKEGNFVDGDEKYQFFFSIIQGKLDLGMGVYVTEYAGGKQIDYDPSIDEDFKDGGMFDSEKLTYKYYPYYPGAVYDDVTKTISGEWNKFAPLADGVRPSEIGLYHVIATYSGDEAFFSETYEGDMNITKANTRIEAKVSQSYAYKFNKSANSATSYHFDLTTAGVIVKSGDSQLWHYAENGNDGAVIVMFYDSNTREWKEIGDSAPVGDEVNGWYQEVGNYTYKVKYLGDEHYNASEIQVTMIITQSVFENVRLDVESGTFVYDGKTNFALKFKPYVDPEYSNARVTYRYNGDDYNSLGEIGIYDAGTHNISMTIRQTGFISKTLTARIEVEKATIEGVTAVAVAATYDGNRHYVTFNGLRKTDDGKYLYDGREVKVVGYGKDENNLWGLNAGEYKARITLSIDNYETKELTTTIVIERAPITPDEARVDLPNQLPSGTNLSERYGYYIVNDERVDCELVYTDEETGKVVALNTSGALPDGKYKVELAVDANHRVTVEWTLIIGDINEKNLSTWAILAVVATVLIMVAAIVTSVVVVNNRKKNEVID